MTQPTSITTRRLLLQGLQELNPYREEDWDDKISELCQALLDLGESADDVHGSSRSRPPSNSCSLKWPPGRLKGALAS